MTDPTPLKQAAEEAKARKLAEVQREAAQHATESEMVSVNGIEIVREDWEALDAIRLGLQEDDERIISFGDADFTVGTWNPARETLLESALNFGISPEGRVIGISLVNRGLKRFIWSLPAALEELRLAGNPVLVFTPPLPSTLRKLDLSNNQLGKFAIPLPPSLEELRVGDSNLYEFSVPIPDSLSEIRIGRSPLHVGVSPFVTHLVSLGFAETASRGGRGVFIRDPNP